MSARLHLEHSLEQQANGLRIATTRENQQSVLDLLSGTAFAVPEAATHLCTGAR